MTLADLAKKFPDYPVRLIFRASDEPRGTGYLDTTISHALNPNASDRFFPPAGFRAWQMAWGRPWWYKSEIQEILDLERRDEYGFPITIYTKEADEVCSSA